MKNHYAYYYVFYRVNGNLRSQMFYREYELKQWYLGMYPIPECVTELLFYRANNPFEAPVEWVPEWAH